MPSPTLRNTAPLGRGQGRIGGMTPITTFWAMITEVDDNPWYSWHELITDDYGALIEPTDARWGRNEGVGDTQTPYQQATEVNGAWIPNALLPCVVLMRQSLEGASVTYKFSWHESQVLLADASGLDWEDNPDNTLGIPNRQPRLLKVVVSDPLHIEPDEQFN